MAIKKILVIALILGVFGATFAKLVFAENPIGDRTIIDKTSCILSANQDAIKWKDTIYYTASKLHTCRFTHVPVVVTNITADTLKYINMSCSRLDIFTTDLKYTRISQNFENCFKNSPAVFTLAPYASVTFDVPIYFFSIESGPGKILTPNEFKIGMGILKYNGKTSMADDFQDIGSMMRNRDNLIWSNTITIR